MVHVVSSELAADDTRTKRGGWGQALKTIIMHQQQFI
jgi:hypothetical protein